MIRRISPPSYTHHPSPVTVRDPLDIGIIPNAAERRYHTIAAKVRLRQAKFRQLVFAAYRSRCAMCSLGHEELLDAAHILPDRDERGQPEVPNGLALCKIHHTSFDTNILGIDADCRVHVREDILASTTGPCCGMGCRRCAGS